MKELIVVSVNPVMIWWLCGIGSLAIVFGITAWVGYVIVRWLAEWD